MLQHTFSIERFIEIHWKKDKREIYEKSWIHQSKGLNTLPLPTTARLSMRSPDSAVFAGEGMRGNVSDSAATSHVWASVRPDSHEECVVDKQPH